MINQMQQQLDFIAYIQRMLNEGDFVATYKLALLHAIADVCVEHQNQQANSQLVIPLDTLAEKLILLYWHHATPFSAADSSNPALLKQSTGNQAKMITLLYECQQNNIRNLHQLKRSPYWKSTLRATLVTLKEGPLWRLQILAKQEECFLYPHNKNNKFIALNAGISDCFRRFYDLVVYLAKNAWLQKIQSIKANQAIIGPQSQLESFLFGTDRNALHKAKPVLIELQSNQCFYCQKKMQTNSVEVDHFIPFARYAHDLGHNFVAAHKKCNNNKRDFLAAHVHRERWQEQNLVVHSKLLENELGAYFYCDAQKSLAVSNWAYEVAIQNSASLWLAPDEFVSATDFATAETKPSNVVSFADVQPQPATQLPYFPNLRIACGHFKTGDDSDVEYIDAPDVAGRVDPKRHFLARASGNSMNGGKNPILDGQLLLLEWVTPTSAGSLNNCTVAIERDDETGCPEYLLRVIKKVSQGVYELIATNPDYEVKYSTENMRTFARLKAIIE